MHNTFGNIFNIQRFSTKDGPGIRTVVFFKGCPLDCVWCHNPESKLSISELGFGPENCIFCGACEKICMNGVHNLNDGHTLLRENCKRCFACAEVCPTDALEKCGDKKSVYDVMQTILRDKPFYKKDGGVTFSGGEPLMQFDFLLSLLKTAKAENIHTSIETSGFTERDLTLLSEYTDLWLYDIKLFEQDAHKKWTGVSNDIILKNLKKLDCLGAKIILRCPIIPDVNLYKEHFLALSNLANELENVLEINLEPYHPLGTEKSQRFGKAGQFENSEFLNAEALVPFIKLIENKTKAPIKII